MNIKNDHEVHNVVEDREVSCNLPGQIGMVAAVLIETDAIAVEYRCTHQVDGNHHRSKVYPTT